MDVSFELKTLRRARGMKQEELADLVGVTPQAVSKWEQGGMPDAALLPAIADALNVSIDALFGREQEELSFYDHFLQHMQQTPWHERIQELFRIGQLCGASLCGVGKYNEFLFSNVAENSYTEATLNEGFYQGRLHEKQPYFLLIPEPQEGYESAVPYDSAFVRLYEALAAPNVLRAMYYIMNEPSAYFDTEAMAIALSISQEETEKIIEKLININVVSQTSFSSGAQNKTIYQGKAYIEFIAFLYFSRMLMSRPSNYCWQTNDRSKPWFNETSLKGKNTP